MSCKSDGKQTNNLIRRLLFGLMRKISVDHFSSIERIYFQNDYLEELGRPSDLIIPVISVLNETDA